MSSLQKKFKLPTFKVLIPAIICGICASDVAVWNVPFKNLVLQASLLTNLSPMGWHWFVFIFKTKTCTNFWIGTVISLVGMIMLVGFQFFIELNFDTSFPVGGIIHIILLFTINGKKSTFYSRRAFIYDHQLISSSIFRNSLFTFRRTFFRIF
jgi:hypothetical protein